MAADEGGTLRIQGKFFEVSGVSGGRGNPDPPKRGAVTTFSDASRRRMVRLIARLGDAVPIFVTLTYGKEWPHDPRVWEVHRTTWFKRLAYLHPSYSAVWRLEPQKRGAPHYHLLLYGGFLDWKWLARSWAECTGDTSPEHLAAGTKVEKLRSAKGAAFYASKYMAKSVLEELPDYWSRPGRWWGVHNRANLPFAPERSVTLSKLQRDQLMSFFRSQVERKLWAKVAAEYGGFVPPGLEDEAKLDKWVVPKVMLSEPDEFLRSFSGYFSDYVWSQTCKRFPGVDEARIAPKVREFIDSQLESFARIA